MAEIIPISPVESRTIQQRNEDQPEKELQNDLEQMQSTNSSLKIEDTPPNGGYGWICVASAASINAHTWGINSSYGVFLQYYLNHDVFPNTSPLVYAFIGGLSISQAMFIAPLATHIIHLYGTKVCLHLGVFFQTISLIGASFATLKYQLILSQGFCFGWGMGFLFVGSVSITPQWFTTKRSLANSISAAGSGAGGLLYSLVTQVIINNLGLAWAFRILGICSFAVNLIASNLLRDRNAQTGARHRAFDWQLLRRPEFLLVQGWSWFSMLGYCILLFSLPAYGRAIGLTANQGSILGAVLNAGQMVGRPFIGLMSDRWGRINLATFLTTLCGIFCFAFWIPAETLSSPMGMLLFFAIVGGTVAGTFWATIAPVGAEVVGLRDLPSALSWTWLLMVPPTTCAEAIALEMRRRNADSWIYLPPQIFTAFMYIAAGLCLWVVRGWKVGEIESAARKMREKGRRQESIMRAEERSIAGHELDGQLGEAAEDLNASSNWEIWGPRNLLRNMLRPKVV